jgi:hypothetical protein
VAYTFKQLKISRNHTSWITNTCQALESKSSNFHKFFNTKSSKLKQEINILFLQVFFLVQDYHTNTTKLSRSNYEFLWDFLKRFRHGRGGKSIRHVCEQQENPLRTKNCKQSKAQAQSKGKTGWIHVTWVRVMGYAWVKLRAWVMCTYIRVCLYQKLITTFFSPSKHNRSYRRRWKQRSPEFLRCGGWPKRRRTGVLFSFFSESFYTNVTASFFSSRIHVQIFEINSYQS